MTGGYRRPVKRKERKKQAPNGAKLHAQRLGGQISDILLDQISDVLLGQQ